MRLSRRTLLGAGTLTAIGGFAFGSGAFSSVQTERELLVTTAEDATARLRIARETEGNTATATANQFVAVDGDGLVSVDVSDANKRARTVLPDLLQIQNNGIEPVIVGYVAPGIDPSKVELFHEDQTVQLAANSGEFPNIGGSTNRGLLRLDDEGPASLASYPVLGVGDTLNDIGLEIDAGQGDPENLANDTATIVAATNKTDLEQLIQSI